MQRALGFGFTLVVLLVIAAAYVGYQGSKSIHENAQELVRGHFVSSGRGAELESQIEIQSQQLLHDEVRVRARHVGGEFSIRNRTKGGVRLEPQAPTRYAESGESNVVSE